MNLESIYISSALLMVLSIATTHSQNPMIFQAVKDVPIHQGYKMKYTFKDQHYLDVEIIPNPNFNDWLALTIEKGVNGTNKLALQTYSGKDLEEIGTDNSYLDVGNCRQIRTFLNNEAIFLIPVQCDNHKENVEVIFVDPVTMTFTNLITLPYSAVIDAQFWSNIHTQEVNLIVLSRVRNFTDVPTILNHYVFNGENASFVKISTINLINALSATVFDINNTTYVGIAKNRNSGGFAYSEILVQNREYGGKLFKYQTLRSKGALRLTYFCYVGHSTTDHFLLTADNELLKDSQKIKAAERQNLFEESIIFKWENNYFIPFQTLLVRLPSPWIMVPGLNDVPILLTWSYIDGIISYQYDGWRFRRTAIHQKDLVNLDPPNFAFLKPVSIGGETVFTIFMSKTRAKRKHFFVPLFRDNSKTRMTYEEKMDWCKNTFLELRLAWSEFGSHYEYLKELTFNKNMSDKDKIMTFFDLVLGFNSRSRLNNAGLEIMSLQGSSTSDSYLLRSSERQHCKITNTNEIELISVTKMIPLENGLIGLKEFDTIVFYPFINKHIEHSQKGTQALYSLRNVDIVFQFQLIEMCKHKGIFIQGFAKGTLFSKVYRVHKNMKLELYVQLKMERDSSVRGYCSKQLGDCFIISPLKDYGTCTIQCGQDLVEYFYCRGARYQDHIIQWDDHTTIGINSNNTIYKVNQKGLSYSSTETIKTVDRATQILMRSTNQHVYFALLMPETIQICQMGMKSDPPMLCKELDIKPNNSKNIQLALVQEELCLFVVFSHRIYIYVVTADYGMILHLKNELKSPMIQPFSIDKSNFISSSSDEKTTIIEFQICRP